MLSLLIGSKGVDCLESIAIFMRNKSANLGGVQNWNSIMFIICYISDHRPIFDRATNSRNDINSTVWLFLEIMFIACLIIGILSFLFMPKQSTNGMNLGQSEKVSIRSDLSVLSMIKPFWLINISFILTILAWGYFYSSFGLWLKGLFHLSESKFGYIAGLDCK